MSDFSKKACEKLAHRTLYELTVGEAYRPDGLTLEEQDISLKLDRALLVQFYKRELGPLLEAGQDMDEQYETVLEHFRGEPWSRRRWRDAKKKLEEGL